MSTHAKSIQNIISCTIRQCTPRRTLPLQSPRQIHQSYRSVATQSRPRFAQAASATPAKPAPSVPPPAATESDAAQAPVIPELQEPDPSHIDWSNSFHGLSVEPFAKEAADILLAPINPEDIEIKPDGIIYLPEIKYRRILNRAFGPGGWGLAPRGEAIVTDKAVTREYALLAYGR